MSNPTTQVMVSGQLVDASLAPDDRTFRNAWQLAGNAIIIDMPSARAIHRDSLRQARAAHFKPLDDVARRLARKKDITGQLTAAEITEYQAAEDQAQTLRDITEDPRIDAADTPEALSALTLDVLTA